MFKALCKMAKGNKGFTLVEIIVVLAIIGVLALILVPRFAGYTKSAGDASDKATAKTIETAVIALIASGKITFSFPESGADAEFELGERTVVVEGSIKYIATGKAALENALQELIGNNLEHSKGGTFTVKISKDLDVSVNP